MLYLPCVSVNELASNLLGMIDRRGLTKPRGAACPEAGCEGALEGNGNFFLLTRLFSRHAFRCDTCGKPFKIGDYEEIMKGG
eukprot:g46541.t1